MRNLRTLVWATWIFFWFTVDQELTFAANWAEVLGGTLLLSIPFVLLAFLHRYLVRRALRPRAGSWQPGQAAGGMATTVQGSTGQATTGQGGTGQARSGQHEKRPLPTLGAKLRAYVRNSLLTLPIVAGTLILLELASATLSGHHERMLWRCIWHVIATAVALWWFLPEGSAKPRPSGAGRSVDGAPRTPPSAGDA